MPSRRHHLARRLVHGAVDVVSDRAPWLTDQAYRAVTAPLQWADPEGAAHAAEARLDDVRARVSAMASTGRVPRTEQRRIRRDLDRTRFDLERIAPRLPAVRARGLARRLAAYTEALAALGAGSTPDMLGASGGRNRAVRTRDAVLLTGAAAGTWTGLLLPVAGPAVVEGGLAAGVVTAVGVTAVRRRRARQERFALVARALAAVDDAQRGPGGVDLRALDHDRRTLLRRALASGRLSPRGSETLRRIDAHLDDLLVRLVDGDLEADSSHLVQATVARYLPDTLEPLLRMPDPRIVVAGRPAAEEVADQLAAIEGGLADAARRPGRNRPETLLLLQGEFLRSKFATDSVFAESALVAEPPPLQPPTRSDGAQPSGTNETNR